MLSNTMVSTARMESHRSTVLIQINNVLESAPAMLDCGLPQHRKDSNEVPE